jgi:hypothetical protein
MFGEELKDDRRLCDIGGGSIGKCEVMGVPGVEGTGEAIAIELLVAGCDRMERSEGPGLVREIRLAGRSILKNFP